MGVAVLYLLATYDIACQFFLNFWTRMPELPSRLHLKIPRANVTVKVPKAHLEVHKLSCHGPFSLNWTWGAGRTDGEGVERLWSWLNKAASSVKEMGASARRETIDDFCAFAAWRKTVGLRACIRCFPPCAMLMTRTTVSYLARRLVDAIKQARVHREEFAAFDAQLNNRFPQQLQAFKDQIAAWEKNYELACPYLPSIPREYLGSAPCPISNVVIGITLNEVRQSIAEEEERAEEQAEAASTPGESPLSFICSGMEIEAQQYVTLSS